MNIRTFLFLAVLSVTAFVFSYSVSQAQSGCCSWHGGVSYCDSSVGRQVCNDGTYSPSCGCAKAQTQPTTTTLKQTADSKQISVGQVNYNGSIRWCGYGEMFDTNNQAKDSIDKAVASISQPLSSQINTLQNDKKSLQEQKDSAESWKGWLIFFLIISLIFNYNQSTDKKA